MPRPDQIERGTGRKVQTEIPMDVHQRMQLEIMRRVRQGNTITIEGLLREMIISNLNTLPRIPDENEVALN